MSNYRRNKRAAIDETDPLDGFSMNDAPSLTDLTDSMLGFASPPPAIPEDALVPVDGSRGAFAYKRFTITSTALDIPDDVTEEEWFDVGAQLNYLDEALQWNIGDLIMYGQDRWDLKYKFIADKLGYEEQTLRAYVYVSRNVDKSIRIASLSHSHHRLVAGLRTKANQPDTKRQRDWLEKAAENNWTLSQMREAMREDKRSSKKSALADVAHKKAFNRIWRRAQTGQPAKHSDIDMLRRWLDKLETSAVD